MQSFLFAVMLVLTIQTLAVAGDPNPWVGPVLDVPEASPIEAPVDPAPTEPPPFQTLLITREDCLACVKVDRLTLPALRASGLVVDSSEVADVRIVMASEHPELYERLCKTHHVESVPYWVHVDRSGRVLGRLRGRATAQTVLHWRRTKEAK